MRLSLIVLILGIFILNPVFAQKRKKGKSSNKVSESPVEKKYSAEFDNYFFKALKEKTKENNTEAISLFQKCIELNPSSDAVCYELSLLYGSAGETKKALVYAKVAAELIPDNVWYQTNLAKLYEDMGDFAASAKVFEQLNLTYPDQVTYYFQLANAYIFSNQFNKAIDTYSILESKIGINSDVSMQKIKLYINQKKIDKADVEAEKLLKLNDDIDNYVKVGELFMSAQAYDYGFKYFSQGLGKEPDNGFLQLAISDYYRYKGNNNEALNYLGKAILNKSIEVDIKIRILLPFIQFAKDSQLFTPLLKITEGITLAHPAQSRAFALYGDFLSQLPKYYKEAIVQYKTAISLDSSKYALFDQVIRLMISETLFQEATVYTEKAIELFPNQGVLYLFAGVAYTQLKDYEKAKSYLERGIGYVGSNKELKMELYSSLGDVLNEMKEYEACFQAYENSLKINPDQAYVLNNYSYYLSLQNNNLVKAKQMSAKSLEIDPNNASFLDTYAWILFKMNEFQDARSFIEKAMKQGAPSAVVYEHYGDILFKLGEKDKAVESWVKALNLDANNSLLKKKIDNKSYYE